MIFNLDYSRKSDIDDSIGYWYVEQRGPEECRVYYSCVTKLRTWVPGPVYSMLTKVALEQTTQWVGVESLKEWEKAKEAKAGGVLGKFGRKLGKQLQGISLPSLPSVTLPEPLEEAQQRAKQWLESHPPPWAAGKASEAGEAGVATAGSSSSGGGSSSSEAVATEEAAAAATAERAPFWGIFGRSSAAVSVGVRYDRSSSSKEAAPAFLPPHLRMASPSKWRLARAKPVPCVSSPRRRG